MSYVKKTVSEMTMLGFERAINEHLQTVKVYGQNKVLVINQEQEKGYEVTIENDKAIACTCPHHQYRGVVCKHMFSVQLSEINAG